MKWCYQMINSEKGIQSIDFASQVADPSSQVWDQPRFTGEAFSSVLYNAMKVLYIYR